MVSRTESALCRMPKKGGLVSATEVDHIVPIEDGGAMFDEANLQGLCKSHHSRKTARDKANRLIAATRGRAGRKSRVLVL